MQKRIYRNMLLLAMISVVLVTVLLSVAYCIRISSQIKGELQNEAIFLEIILNRTEDDIGYLEEITPLGKGIRISLVSSEGNVVYDSRYAIERMGNHKDREEIQEALQHGVGESRRYSETMGEEIYYYSRRLSSEAVLRLSKTSKSIWGVFYSGIPVGIFLVIGILTICHFLAKSLTRQITKPINEINLDTRVAVYDELSLLIRTITQQKEQIEKQFAELEKRAGTIAAITENMQEGLLLLDEDARVLSANKSGENLFGIVPAEGRNMVELTRDAVIHQHIQRALAGERSNITTERSNKTYMMFFSPVPQSGAIVLLLDITVKANAEKLRREFSANVSHELKTPLTSISGYVEMMENDMVKPKDVSLVAKKIRKESTRLLSLIDDILMLSQLDETTQSQAFSTISLDAIAMEVVDSLQSKAEERKIDLQTAISPLSLAADPRMMFELLYNLVDNAIKYNRKDGKIKVTVTREGEKAKILVADTGIGISYENHDRIFERFYCVDKSHSKKTGGTGLGLSIVKHIVACHQGEILLESEKNLGTTITVWLPMES